MMLHLPIAACKNVFSLLKRSLKFLLFFKKKGESTAMMAQLPPIGLALARELLRAAVGSLPRQLSWKFLSLLVICLKKIVQKKKCFIRLRDALERSSRGSSCC